MPADEYDIAGFSVGIVDQEKIIDGSRLEKGDVLIGLHSSGVHSNGFSLVRRVLDLNRKNVNAHVDDLSAISGRDVADTDKDLRQADAGAAEQM